MRHAIAYMREYIHGCMHAELTSATPHFFDMRDQAKQAEFVFSPLVHSTQIDEDYIGRPSRVSRRTSSRTVMIRTIERCLEASHAQMVESGMLILHR